MWAFYCFSHYLNSISGNLKNWWANSTKESYNAKAKCIIDQYSSYKPKQVDLNLNGINGQGENIADNGGIKEAYMAYGNEIKFCFVSLIFIIFQRHMCRTMAKSLNFRVYRILPGKCSGLVGVTIGVPNGELRS